MQGKRSSLDEAALLSPEREEERKLAVCGSGWQEKYKRLHTDILQKRRPSKFLVYSCAGRKYGCGGYGNRLNAIASLFLLAVLTDRAFIIDWRSTISMDTFWEPKHIDWNFPVLSMTGLKSRRHFWGKGHPLNVGSDVVRPASDMNGIVEWIKKEDIPTYFNTPVEVVTNVWYLVDMILENPSTSDKAVQLGLRSSAGAKYSFLGCASDFLFKMSPILEKELEAARTSLGLPRSMPFVGLHVRMGDEKFGFKGRMTNDFKRFFECAKQGERFLERADSGRYHEIKWFLATDDTDVKSYARREYVDKVVTLNLTIQHIDKLGKRDLSSQGMLGVLLDHFFLSESSISVLSPSTFGLTARALRFQARATFTYGETCTFWQQNKRLYNLLSKAFVMQ